MSRIKKLGVAAGIAALATVAGAATYQYLGSENESAADAAAAAPRVAAASPNASSMDNLKSDAASGVPAGGMKAAVGGAPGTFIVVFKEDALATYMGTRAGLAAPQRRLNALGQAKLDAKSASSRNYVSYLKGRQATIQGGMERTLGRPLAVRMSMQHALNAIVTDMTNAEAAALRADPNVRLVEAYAEYPLDTDVGPTLIGAPAVWAGTTGTTSTPYQGEGMVLGIVDSGINFESPSFAAVDPIDGYQHVNPRGAGNYLGTCATGGVDAGRCNDKLIGGYDFVCDLRTSTDPTNPATICSQPAVYREEPGFGDTNGHGTHTASTSGGNRRNASYRGNTIRISGVAPRANIIAYDVCYTEATGQQRGLCPNVSTAAAVNQAVADGIVDAINYSIGGGTQPWSDAISTAFLNAVEAGIYVAASAGNSGPGPNTMGHLQPWVSSTAAAQHGRGDFVFALSIAAPAPVPANLQAIVVNEGGGGVPHTSAIPNTTPVRISPNINALNDGCNAAPFPAGYFTGSIAVIRRGTCAFTEKAANAAAAGAIAMVVANNQAGAIAPTVTGATIRAFGMQQADANALRDFAAANPTAVTGGINYPAASIPNVPDALAGFSSRGPAGAFDLVKPDVTAPGVLVLAAVSPTAAVTGNPNVVELLSGTSMASPHQAGAAALIRQARPSWSVPEVKSALAMTADETVKLEDQVTPANGFAGGAGRIRVDKAMNAGLVLNETAVNYRAANPATGGDVASLNQPSMARGRCVQSCEFVRTFRNTLPTAQAYRVTVEGLAGRASPATLKVPAGGSASVRIIIDSSALAPGVWTHGKVRLEPVSPRVSTTPTLHLPVAVRVPPPPPASTPLQNGVPLAGLSGATGSNVFYTLAVPAGRTRLTVTTSGGTGDVDVAIGRIPEGPYECVSAADANAESCIINNPAPATWYIRLNGFAAYSGVTLTATYQ